MVFKGEDQLGTYEHMVYLRTYVYIRTYDAWFIGTGLYMYV